MKTLDRATSLGRFHAAHDRDGAYPRALREIQAGRKRSHWMWFVFPQLRALAKSETARFYGIADRTEAIAYIDDPVLRMRLGECTRGILGHNRLMLSHPDNHKLRSCMTLFSQVTADPALPDAVLAKFYGGKRDQLTLDALDGKPIVLPSSPRPPALLRPPASRPLPMTFDGPDDFRPWPQAQVYAFVRSFGLSPAETHRLVRAWMADQDRSYDAGWNEYADRRQGRT